MEIITTANLNEIWYQYYHLVKEHFPELLDEYLENTAAKLEITVDYLMQEFLT